MGRVYGICVVTVAVVMCAGEEGIVPQVRFGVDDGWVVARWGWDVCLLQGPTA